MISLRPYQEQIKSATRNALLSGYLAVLIVLATGGGKTFIGCSIILDALNKKRRILVLVHRDKLIQMWSKDLKKLNIPFGVIQGDTQYTEAPVQIASVDTYINRIGDYGDFDILMADEAHRACADGYSRIIEHHKKRGSILLGMTATPSRLDGIGLNNLFDYMAIGVTMKELIDDGYLTRMEIYSASPPDLDLEITDGEFNKKQYLRKVSGPARITGIIDICKKHTGKLGVTFAVNISDAKKITKEMNDNGIPAVCIHSKQTKKHQDSVIKKWRNREYLQLVSVDVITEGFNEIEIQYSIDASPTGSLVKYIQRLGRVVRAWYRPGLPLETREQRLYAIAVGEKPIVYHYDICGNWWLWCNPWDDHHWTLEGRKITKKDMQDRILSIRLCTNCGRNYNAALDSCPHCHDPITRSKRVIKEASGKLILVTELEACAHEAQVRKEEEAKKDAEERKKAVVDDINTAKETFYAARKQVRQLYNDNKIGEKEYKERMQKGDVWYRQQYKNIERKHGLGYGWADQKWNGILKARIKHSNERKNKGAKYYRK